jgi:hypothetical protein
MSANGMCPHNNLSNYCPSCCHDKARAMAGMGADACPAGYYRLKIFGVDTGQCLPSGSTALDAAQGGVLQSAAAGVAQSSATQSALSNASANAIGTKIVNFYKQSPTVAIGATLGVGALLVYGAMSFLKR